MPQLIPAPWFFILLSFWLILILFAPKKILSYILPNDPTTKHFKTTYQNWAWPWQ
uniref:ATP synthase complex subunit 8 n=1 Tax=Mantophryne lateralis TaxID=512497 RepID=A0A343VT62_9NEOB|nr:ATP synthase subunit 8 [Mantophryne lateralis]